MSTDFGDQDVEQDAAGGDPAFENVIEFVEQFVAPVIRRKVSEFENALSWDARWWRYPEVAARFKALHLAYEDAYASDDLSAMSNWWLQHLDPHLAIIMDPNTGPMSNANPQQSFSGWPQLPTEPVPDEARNQLLKNY